GSERAPEPATAVIVGQRIVRPNLEQSAVVDDGHLLSPPRPTPGPQHALLVALPVSPQALLCRAADVEHGARRDRGLPTGHRAARPVDSACKAVRARKSAGHQLKVLADETAVDGHVADAAAGSTAQEAPAIEAEAPAG